MEDSIDKLNVMKEKVEELFILAKQNTKDGELARDYIKEMCDNYINR